LHAAVRFGRSMAPVTCPSPSGSLEILLGLALGLSQIQCIFDRSRLSGLSFHLWKEAFCHWVVPRGSWALGLNPPRRKTPDGPRLGFQGSNYRALLANRPSSSAVCALLVSISFLAAWLLFQVPPSILRMLSGPCSEWVQHDSAAAAIPLLPLPAFRISRPLRRWPQDSPNLRWQALFDPWGPSVPDTSCEKSMKYLLGCRRAKLLKPSEGPRSRSQPVAQRIPQD